MDGSNVDHSDSDSGESWTMLEHSPVYAEDVAEVPDTPSKHDGEAADNTDRDEDTDGISIISDSEAESPSPIEHLSCEENPACDVDDRPAETHISQNLLVSPPPYNNSNIDNESMKGKDDFVGDRAGKLRTYVHRRNKRLSTVLNIIVLGSIITAAGVAIGHMWGVRDDCSDHSTQSVNKILSNLYKLQEENAYLRSKLKELTMVSNANMKLTPKHNMLRCKKVFEEPLNNRNVERLTKCIEHDNTKTDKLLESHLVVPDFEKQYLNDIDKLRNVYKQNRSWLDEEVARRLKDEELSTKRLKDKFNKPGKTVKLNKTIKSGSGDNQILVSIQEDVVSIRSEEKKPVEVSNLEEKEKKVSYADSLKFEADAPKTAKKRDISSVHSPSDHGRRKRAKKEVEAATEKCESDDEVKKDDRYAGNRHKLDKNKHDRQKTHKKQKRRNKYEQWEMKGGYMKDFDEFSLVSALDNERTLPTNPNTNPDKNFRSQNFESVNYMDQFSETDENAKTAGTETVDLKAKKSKKERNIARRKGDMDWFEKRAVIRSEARKTLERELFGETSPNTAAWYFRRMKKREQCRVKGDNSTHKKIPKRSMNFKTKN